MAMVTPRHNRIQWHKTTCGNCTYELPVKYTDLTPIGVGAFGAVIRATDTEKRQFVAIKKLLRPFQTRTYAQRAYRELSLLVHLNNPNAQIVQLYDVFTPDNTLENFQTLYFVFNYAGSNLRKTIQFGSPLQNKNIRRIVYLILRGLKYAHSAGVIHRDLKPENIGIDSNGYVTILDFGLSRIASDGIQTGYVATRWWRAPEVFINWERYDEKIDIWSVGCIMAELILRHPVFPGNDYIDQLNKIFDIIGTPSLETLHEICTAEPLAYLSRLESKPPKDFQKLFGYKYDSSGQAVSGVSHKGVDLLRRLLSFDPRLRPTVEEALAHPYLRQFHNSRDEPAMQFLVDKYQDADLSLARWKVLIWQMIQNFKPPSWIDIDIQADE